MDDVVLEPAGSISPQTREDVLHGYHTQKRLPRSFTPEFKAEGVELRGRQLESTKCEEAYSNRQSTGGHARVPELAETTEVLHRATLPQEEAMI